MRDKVDYISTIVGAWREEFFVTIQQNALRHHFPPRAHHILLEVWTGQPNTDSEFVEDLPSLPSGTKLALPPESNLSNSIPKLNN